LKRRQHDHVKEPAILLPCFLLSQFLTSSSFFTSFFPSLLPSFLPSFLSASLVSILSFSRRGVVCPFARARAHASGRASERASERAQPLAIRPRGLTGGARRHNGTRIPRSGDVLASLPSANTVTRLSRKSAHRAQRADHGESADSKPHFSARRDRPECAISPPSTTSTSTNARKLVHSRNSYNRSILNASRMYPRINRYTHATNEYQHAGDKPSAERFMPWSRSRCYYQRRHRCRNLLHAIVFSDPRIGHD
jgi:hypothetical protein